MIIHNKNPVHIFIQKQHIISTVIKLQSDQPPGMTYPDG